MNASLPPLRIPGSKAEILPTAVVDAREQTPLPIRRLPAIRGTLYTGDYSFRGGEHLFSIERKSLDDLAQCCGTERTRFENELHRLRGYEFARLLIVGTEDDIRAGLYRSKITPAAVLGSLAAWEIRYDVPIVFEPTPEAAARRVERWAWYAAREHIRRTAELFRTPTGG